MKVDWTALGAVFVVSLGVVLGLVVLFCAGIRGVSVRETARENGGAGTGGTATAVLSFGACALVVLVGIYLIVSG